MNNYSFIANFTKNLDQLNKWGIDSNELTYLVNSYGALTDIIEGTHDSIELIFHDVIT